MEPFPSPPDEGATLEILGRIRAGEGAAWDDLYRRYHDQLLLTIRASLGRKLRGSHLEPVGRDRRDDLVPRRWGLDRLCEAIHMGPVDGNHYQSRTQCRELQDPSGGAGRPGLCVPSARGPVE